MSELGDRIVTNYNNSSNQEPGGDCFAVAYARVNEACVQVCRSGLPSLTTFARFDRLWAIKNDPRASWLTLPENYRGKGSAGAMASIGHGTLVEADVIWNGSLQPGAVVQTWVNQSGYTDARDGIRNGETGHSFIFREYVRNAANQVVAMRIADQGTRWSRMANGVSRSEFSYWIAANVDCPTRHLSALESDTAFFQGYVRRVNMEPIGMGRDRKLVCSAFIASQDQQVQVYTDDPRLESAVLTAYLSMVNEQKPKPNVEIYYTKEGDDNVLKRIDLVDLGVPGS